MRNIMIAAAGLLMLAACGKKENTDTVTGGDTLDNRTVTPAEEAFKPQCYLEVTTGKADNSKGKTLNDSLLFTIDNRKGDSVWGKFEWKPAEKDKKIATYKGVLKGTNGNAIANSNAEGMNYNEEVIFTLKDNTLSVKFGEMAEGKDGIWYYKDKDKLSEQVLPKVDCQ